MEYDACSKLSRIDTGTIVLLNDSAFDARLSDLLANLSADRSEIERLARSAIARIEPASTEDSSVEYARGVSKTVEALLDYVLTCLVAGSTAMLPVPVAALEQARQAPKTGIALDVLMRRYMAGNLAVRRALAGRITALDPLVADNVHSIADEAIDAVLRCAAAEFEAETTRISRLPNQVLRMTLGLLREEVLISELDGYILDRWHIGVVTEAPVPKASLSRLAVDLGAQSFIVDSQIGQCWVWIGRTSTLGADTVEDALNVFLDQNHSFGLGEARRGLSGWRLTHAEARRAAELPGSDGRRVTRMRRHVLEVAALENRTYTESLIATYIEPLEDEPTRIAADLRTTLVAYLRSGQNAKSAAQLLGIDRHTVIRRVRKVEDLVGERVEDCFAQLDTALRLARIQGCTFE